MCFEIKNNLSRREILLKYKGSFSYSPSRLIPSKVTEEGREEGRKEEGEWRGPTLRHRVNME